MADNFFPSQDVSVFFVQEANVGGSADTDDTGFTQLQTTSFTIPEASVPVEYSGQRSGSFVALENQGPHSQGTKMWTFETTLKGTPESVLLATNAVFEQGSSEAVLNNNYTFPSVNFKDGAGSAKTFEIRFENAGSDSSSNNVICQGCVGTGFTLTEDIGSEGGELVCTINWATGYMPNNVTGASDALGSPSYHTQTPKNIRDLDFAETKIDSEPLVCQSWELNVSRTIERIHFKDQTGGSFKPFGYAMVGGFEVTGSLTVIRNDDVHDLLAKFYDGSTVNINIEETTASKLTITMPKCYINEPSIDNGGAVLTETIPFTVVGADDISSTTKMLGVTIAP